MYLAHALTPGGPEIELLLLAGAVAYMGILFFVKKAVKPVVSLVLVLAAAAIAVGSFTIGGSSASSGATVSIDVPRSGSVVPAGEPIAVRASLRGGTLTTKTSAEDANAGHLHIYVDEKLISMPATERFEVELRPGPHTVTVEFTAADHSSFEPRVLDDVAVTAR